MLNRNLWNLINFKWWELETGSKSCQKKFYFNSIDDKGALGLGSGLAQCINLQNLTFNLGFNQIGSMGGSGLGSGLANYINLSNLTIDLRFNQIGDEGTSGLGYGLANCINLSNLTIDLRGNQIGDEGAFDSYGIHHYNDWTRQNGFIGFISCIPSIIGNKDYVIEI
ncbi:hypothetical protein TTHERM_001362542 (macronuclear) [Tetrahymena thermophila SB210]|uniref:Oxalate/formate antiporter protein n=1 Tax=Tetrahymena thermophila (strain SB210) TaxID=312017 RepID=W7X4R7_TETTS|nr:hypothetical protein TTHERM_001362542 [Tetrahymena thermophila SB210]EWS71358.1 hypothetical protein TTHERM_001362542 [Tetrahymena thermophila SB210]|eukprot:XP_012656110.1 hypothetical protein TTHERM_001362542 [Tetrahymena thermophila SB210]